MKKIAFNIVLSLIASSMMAGCGRTSPPPKEDNVPPTVVAYSPGNQSLDNSINTSISIEFSESVDPASLIPDNLTLRDAMTNAVIAGDISYSEKTVVLKPTSPLQTFTAYIMQVGTGVRDLAGNAMLLPLTFNFTTGAEGDVTPPDIVQTMPVDGAQQVGVNATISVSFNEQMLSSSITTSPPPVMVSSGSSTVNVGISLFNSSDGTTVIFSPKNTLDHATTYTVTVYDTVTDLAGNRPQWVDGTYRWQFETETEAPDTTRPYVLYTQPATSAEEIPVTARVVANFSETMLSSSISETTFLLSDMQTGSPVQGTTSVISGASADFTPLRSLKPATNYLVTLVTDSAGTGMTDVAGNFLLPNSPQGYTWKFRTESALLMITKAGKGSGIVSADTGTVTWTGITGLATYSEYGTIVTLTAAADAGSTFIGWSGEGCGGTDTCTVAMTQARYVTATFLQNSYSLSVSKTGTGTGTVSADTGTLIWTGNIGTATYSEYGTIVTLTAAADAGSTFIGWSGEGCSGTDACTVTMTQARSVAAMFVHDSYPLTITKIGTGSGIISVSTGTLTWTGNIGTATYTEYGTIVTLTAVADADSLFTGWSGEDCAGTGTCTVTMSQARNVTAAFIYNSYSLTVTKAGTGSGIVSTNTGTVTWSGNTGLATYSEYGTIVTLTAAADTGSTFAGWSGEGCAGTGTCTVTMTQARSVTATFMYDSYVLAVTRAGTGNGIISVNTGTLIWTGNTGTSTYTEYGTMVILTASASAGSTFAGWSGEGCTGTGTCTVTMTQARNLTATFTMYTFTLTATQNGNGSGVITTDTGVLIWNGNTGTAAYEYGVSVGLTAVAEPGSAFTGWAGCDSVDGALCSVTMTAPKSVTATFARVPK